MARKAAMSCAMSRRPCRISGDVAHGKGVRNVARFAEVRFYLSGGEAAQRQRVGVNDLARVGNFAHRLGHDMLDRRLGVTSKSLHDDLHPCDCEWRNLLV